MQNRNRRRYEYTRYARHVPPILTSRPSRSIEIPALKPPERAKFRRDITERVRTQRVGNTTLELRDSAATEDITGDYARDRFVKRSVSSDSISDGDPARATEGGRTSGEHSAPVLEVAGSGLS